LNEAVNEELRAIFIAIPKTGTTTVRSQIRPVGTPLIPNSHLNILEIRETLFTLTLRRALHQNKAFPTSNILTTQQIQRQSQEMFDSYYKFSAVRNPWARAASLYSRRESISASETMSFEQFCEQHLYASDTCIHPTLHRNQCDWLCDEREECLMDYVYKIEEFDQAISEIYEQTNGRIQLENILLNHNPNSKSQAYRTLYNDRTQRTIAKKFEKDIDIFKYAF